MAERRLGEIGIRVLYHTTVADDLTANVNVFRAASQRADVVIATGGLGPTADDLTREVLAELAGVELEMHDEIVEQIRCAFCPLRSRHAREEQSSGTLSSRQPNHSESDGHGAGIAQEIALRGRESCRVYALPGVPSEMFRMWEETVRPELRAHLQRTTGDSSSPHQMFRSQRKRARGAAARSNSPRPDPERRHHGQRSDNYLALRPRDPAMKSAGRGRANRGDNL